MASAQTPHRCIGCSASSRRQQAAATRRSAEVRQPPLGRGLGGAALLLRLLGMSVLLLQFLSAANATPALRGGRSIFAASKSQEGRGITLPTPAAAEITATPPAARRAASAPAPAAAADHHRQQPLSASSLTAGVKGNHSYLRLRPPAAARRRAVAWPYCASLTIFSTVRRVTAELLSFNAHN